MISITQEQKKVLNDNGVMVSEFKLWCKKAYGAVCDVCRAIAEYLVLVVRKLCEAWQPIAKAFQELANKIGETEWDDTSKEIASMQSMTVKDRYRYCKVNGYPYQLFIKRKYQFHCRNNC